MINAICIHPIVILKWEGNDEWGEPKTPTRVDVRGYVEWKTVLVPSLAGEEVASQVNVRLPIRRTDLALGRTLDHKDRMIIDNVLERTIITIAEPAALKHPRIYQVFLA